MANITLTVDYPIASFTYRDYLVTMQLTQRNDIMVTFSETKPWMNFAVSNVIFVDSFFGKKRKVLGPYEHAQYAIDHAISLIEKEYSKEAKHQSYFNRAFGEKNRTAQVLDF